MYVRLTRARAVGWVFVIIVLCGLFLYFVLGIVILKFALHKEGRDVVPNVEFWAALPGLVVDGIKCVFCAFLCIFVQFCAFLCVLLMCVCVCRFSFRKITCQAGGYTEV